MQPCCVLRADGCTLDIGVKGGQLVGVRGRAVDRVNRGRLGPKGHNGWQANNSPGRFGRDRPRPGDSPSTSPAGDAD